MSDDETVITSCGCVWCDLNVTHTDDHCTRREVIRALAIDDATALVNRWAEDEEVLALEATNDEDMGFYKRCASRHRELAKFVAALKDKS
jgi:hypothetical protein